ncbi:hypothetical protein BJF90_08865 [Pseudonocardia sp. CNS-004]|nr:hypothetical protein BJF90_08865 [Pseudonocardia sp. CNS-004]
MLVDFRPHTRLRGTAPVDLTTSLVPVVEALGEGAVDLAKVRVVSDWVQYRENFRDVVDVRPILHSARRVPARASRSRWGCARTTSRSPSTCGAATASRSRS